MHRGAKTSLATHMLSKKKEVPVLKRGGNWMERLAEGMDLPGEPLPGQPLIEVAGERRVLIEHHRGVTQYSREEICVKVSYGNVQIRGCSLELTRMTAHQLVISGRIDCVMLHRR